MGGMGVDRAVQTAILKDYQLFLAFLSRQIEHKSDNEMLHLCGLLILPLSWQFTKGKKGKGNNN